MQARISKFFCDYGGVLWFGFWGLYWIAFWFYNKGIRGVAQDIGMVVLMLVFSVIVLYSVDYVERLCSCVRWEVVWKRLWWYFCEAGVWFARIFLPVAVVGFVGLLLLGAWYGDKGRAPSAQDQEAPHHGKRASVDGDNNVEEPFQRGSLLRP